MNQELWGPEQFQKLFQQGFSLLDVRAPVEFAEGQIPNSVNIPLLNNEERKLVGTTYKQKGHEKAIQLGHELVSGPVKEERLAAWIADLQANPKRLITCFRGGLRSKTVQQWCAEAGVARPRIQGGYKALRQFLMQEITDFSVKGSLLVVSGATGSAKSKLLRSFSAGEKALLDLEKYAHHRGSAFGGYSEAQPAQATFENLLAVGILSLPKIQNVLVEDESRLIGRSVQPDIFFEKLRNSPIVLIEEPLSVRVQNTFEDYILNSAINSSDEVSALALFDRYIVSTQNIQKRLGGLRCSEVLHDLQNSKEEYKQGKGLESNRVWIEKLLLWYYDPLYLGSLQKRQPNKVFQGNWQQVREFLLHQS